MAEKTLIARTRPDEVDSALLLITSPVVGIAEGSPRKGVFLNSLDRIVSIKIMGERHVIRLPRNVHGWVAETYFPNCMTPLAFGDPLIRLDPRAAQTAGDALPEVGSETDAPGGSEAPGAIIISSPSDGIFYRRSSPGSDPYVEVGSVVTPGTVLGLVEVMKCFNQITYGGVGFSRKCTVSKILADDTAEVQFGQALFWVKPEE